MNDNRAGWWQIGGMIQLLLALIGRIFRDAWTYAEDEDFDPTDY